LENLDKNIPVRDDADYSFKVANLIQEASKHEFGDPEYLDQNKKPLTHRDMAVDVLKSVGNYAGLSDEEKNGMMIPEWIERNVEEIQEVYAGKKGDLRKLAIAIGAHIFSGYD